jgi:predicted nucleic acid-binding Zn ribbon protein
MLSIRDTATEAVRQALSGQPDTPAKVTFAWRLAAGAAMARAAQVTWVADRRTLRLTPADQAWRRELTRARPVLLERLQHLLGGNVVETIVIENIGTTGESERRGHA